MNQLAVVSEAGREPNLQPLIDVLFAFVVKGARRLLQLNPDELKLLKSLFVAFADAGEEERPEILETMLEIILPEDRIGGVAKGLRAPSADLQERLLSSRRYIGEQIKKRRESLGMTQLALAKKAKIPQSHVSRLERGKHAPTRLTIERVAEALRIAPEKLDPGYETPEDRAM